MRTFDLRRVRRLGAGGEGTTWLEQDRDTGQYYVCKELEIWRVKQGQPLEVRIRRDCMPSHHRNLLDLHGWHCMETNAGPRCRIYYEYCAGGDLWELIPSGQSARYPESFIWHVFIQLAEALDAMHNRGPKHVVHRDVKPENVFLTSRYRPNHSYPTLKLGDYGFAGRKRVGGDCGMWQYMGPEIECSAKGDIWALGAIIHELCHGFSAVSKAHHGWKRDPGARRPQNLPSRYSNNLNRHMMWCLNVHRRDRPNSETLVRRLHGARPGGH